MRAGGCCSEQNSFMSRLPSGLLENLLQNSAVVHQTRLYVRLSQVLVGLSSISWCMLVRITDTEGLNIWNCMTIKEWDQSTEPVEYWIWNNGKLTELSVNVGDWEYRYANQNIAVKQVRDVDHWWSDDLRLTQWRGLTLLLINDQNEKHKK